MSGTNPEAQPRWVTSALLVALAARSMHKGAHFTSADMRAWVPRLARDAQRKSAASTLLHAGFVTQASTVGQLRAELMAIDAQHAESLGQGRAVRTALNQVLCTESALLSDGAEVAFFPPVTGG